MPELAGVMRWQCDHFLRDFGDALPRWVFFRWGEQGDYGGSLAGEPTARLALVLFIVFVTMALGARASRISLLRCDWPDKHPPVLKTYSFGRRRAGDPFALGLTGACDNRSFFRAGSTVRFGR